MYDEWQYTFPNLAEVLEAFPTLRIPASMLLTLLPLLRPRYYSISSSPRLNPGEVHLTVAVVQYKAKGTYNNAFRTLGGSRFIVVLCVRTLDSEITLTINTFW